MICELYSIHGSIRHMSRSAMRRVWNVNRCCWNLRCSLPLPPVPPTPTPTIGGVNDRRQTVPGGGVNRLRSPLPPPAAIISECDRRRCLPLTPFPKDDVTCRRLSPPPNPSPEVGVSRCRRSPPPPMFAPIPPPCISDRRRWWLSDSGLVQNVGGNAHRR